jgi:hypothetical protein
MKIILKKRKAMNYKSITLINLILLVLHPLSAQSSSETRSYIKTIQVSRETSLEVSNKYGTIQITPWNKDSAYIRAEVKAFATSDARLKKMFDGVSVKITDSKFLVSAQTEFTQNINMLFECFKGMTSNMISYDSRVEINYFIKIPEYLNLKIVNKYGDVFMESTTGDLSVTVSNGSLKAESLGQRSDLTISFCDANINSIASGKINASFSEVTLGETADLTVTSISSRFDIKKAGVISLESRRDKYFLGNVETLRGSSYFTDFKLGSLKKELNLTSRYGNFTADLIERDFESIDMNSGYSDISLWFDQNSSYNLDIRYINTFLVLPDKNVNTEKKALDSEKKEYMVFGTVGEDPAKSKVKIDANRGNIYLK